MHPWPRPLLLLGAATLAAGCQCEPAGLVVDLRTNFVAGVELDSARTEVWGGDSARTPVHRSEQRLDWGAPVEDGVRIAETGPLDPGHYTVEVTLRREGSVLAQRTLLVEVRGVQLSTILITRDCRSITCPDGTTCQVGQCVPQDCIDGSGFDGCPPINCAEDDDCTTTVACAEPLCLESHCQPFPRHTDCAVNEWCNPERGCLILPVFERDAGVDVETDAGPDVDAASPPCTAGACDDGNPCTDDTCEADGCAFVPNTNDCDDGTFCNGPDTCEGGRCALSAGDPCPGASVCNEVGDTCEGCSGAADCPTEVAGPWSPCAFPSACASSGSQTRSVSTYLCTAGTCEPTARTETQSCTRPSREGTACGATSCGAWSGCGYSDTCDESATETRACTDRACRSDVCADVGRTESRGCSRSTSGMSCGSRYCDPWGPCDYADECERDAQRQRTCYDRRCGGGRCVDQPSPETEPCSRATEGNRCGSNPRYCGNVTDCHLCRSGSCALNAPHYDAACNPSCGHAGSLCGVPATCCAGAGSCAQVNGGGPYADCSRCCQAAVCF